MELAWKNDLSFQCLNCTDYVARIMFRIILVSRVCSGEFRECDANFEKHDPREYLLSVPA